VHFLKPYRAEHTLKITALLGLKPTIVASYRSEALHAAVVAQRNVKSADEVAEIERAVGVSREMYLANGCELAFPIICSVHGETLHNHAHANLMKAGDVMVLDSGVETERGYASDITRTIPVGGRFTAEQRVIYDLVLKTQLAAIAAIKPGVRYKDVHLLASRSFASGLKEIGLMKGDPAEAVAAGAHALFFPHGLGHMLGLDVHDLENVGEQHVGYEPGLERSGQFGLSYLRLARTLKPGFVLTVEPGLYFIPQLIDQWKADKRHAAFVNYREVEKFRNARGYRIEDDVLVTRSGNRVLGPPIPKKAEDVEAACRAARGRPDLARENPKPGIRMEPRAFRPADARGRPAASFPDWTSGPWI